MLLGACVAFQSPSPILPCWSRGRSQPTRLPPSDTLWGHGSGVATCRRSISMSGMLVNQLYFASGKFWVWLRRVAQFMKRMSIKRRLPLTVRTRHEEMPSGTLPPPEHSQVLHDSFACVFWLWSSSEVFKIQLSFFFFFFFLLLCICKINITSLYSLIMCKYSFLSVPSVYMRVNSWRLSQFSSCPGLSAGEVTRHDTTRLSTSEIWLVFFFF